MSVVPPVIIGTFVGFMSAIMGIGGGFVMIPAMIYLLRMPTGLVIGTSLFQIVFVGALGTVLHAVENKTVDIVLAAITRRRRRHRRAVRHDGRGEAPQRAFAGLARGFDTARRRTHGFDLVVRPEDLFSLALLRRI